MSVLSNRSKKMVELCQKKAQSSSFNKVTDQVKMVGCNDDNIGDKKNSEVLTQLDNPFPLLQAPNLTGAFISDVKIFDFNGIEVTDCPYSIGQDNTTTNELLGEVEILDFDDTVICMEHYPFTEQGDSIGKTKSNIVNVVDCASPEGTEEPFLSTIHENNLNCNMVIDLLNVSDQVSKKTNDLSDPPTTLLHAGSPEDEIAGSSVAWIPSVADIEEETSDSSCDNIPLSLLARKKRKKGHGPMQRKLRKERSEKHKQGEKYVTAKGKCISARKPKDITVTCRAKCHEKVANINLNQMYQDYRQLPSREAQQRYLAGLIIIEPTIRRRIRNASGRNRQISVYYKLDGVSGTICKTCFLNIFAETIGFLNGIINRKNKSPTSSIVLNHDSRGLQRSGNRRSDEDIEFARQFINSFPAYESHYSRRHSAKKYLQSNMNLQLLYNLYKKKFLETNGNAANATPISITIFRNIFKSLNLKFKKPSNDTCKTCDSLQLKIKSSGSEVEKVALQNEQELHQEKAQFHYTTKKQDKKLCEDSSGKSIVVAFDLQKCLATPNLTSSISFYKRKLWTFNLTVRNINTRKTSCYMWHEGTAQRGANEISSCLYRFIMDMSDNVETLTLYSDTCPGQNRNNILPVMFMVALQKKKSLKEIHHKFLVPGHTHLECDCDHALIERFLKKHNTTISVPQDWMSLVKMTNSRFEVKLMTQNDFYDFSKLLTTQFQKRNIDIENSSFAWNNVFWLMYKRSKLGHVAFKYTLELSDEFRYYSMLRRGRQVSMDDVQPTLAYNGPLQIEAKKYKDILDLLPFIDPIYHEFYRNLKHAESVTSYVSDSDENFED